MSASLTLANRDTLYTATKDSLVPTQAALDAVAKAKAARPRRRRSKARGSRPPAPAPSMVRELYLFAGDGTYVHQIITTGQATTVTQFDAGFGYRYGRYTLTGSTLTTTRARSVRTSRGPTTTPQTRRSAATR